MNTFEQTQIKRERARDWLRYIRHRGKDRRWLVSYDDQLVKLIQRGIYTPPELPDTLELLMEVVPYFVAVRFHIEQWSYLMMDALMQAAGLKDDELQARLLNALADADMQAGRHQQSEAR